MKMLPFAEPSFFETLPRIFFRMPRVVLNQRAKFESDELFRKLSRECEIRYTGFKDKSIDERQIRFYEALRNGLVEITFQQTGTNFQLIWGEPLLNGNLIGFNNIDPYGNGCDISKDPGKVHMVSRFIMNGVCIRFRGYLDLKKLDGSGCLEFDEESAKIEDAILRQQYKFAAVY